jgi:soluble lytic murein transglycosylase-like protein
MADVLDPTANARNALRFLRDLHARYGDWNQAVVAYHFATGALDGGYHDRIIAQWEVDRLQNNR